MFKITAMLQRVQLKRVGLIDMLTRMASTNSTKVDIGGKKLGKEDFNEAGFIRPSRHALLHEKVRICGSQSALPEDYYSSTKKESYFVRHQQGFVDENITSDMISEPIYGTYSITYIGTSSIVCHSKLILEKQQKCISTCIVQVICVNLESRRPCPVPKLFTDAHSYAAHAQKPNFPDLSETLKSSDEIYSKKVIVGDDDVDVNKHMNQASYFKFCIDVAQSYFRSRPNTDKILTYVTPYILNGQLRGYIAQYFGETQRGDELHYTMWQDLKQDHLLNFEAKKQNNVVFRGQLDFN
ncbi:uncharacterized protein [Antedon mediterranea]|uniref:uncharacterized protein n=1 Tax=Antedon mediterranea TaxID=105859 RepID=UPI003AF46BC9